jgi:hypothetical protein
MDDDYSRGFRAGMAKAIADLEHRVIDAEDNVAKINAETERLVAELRERTAAYAADAERRIVEAAEYYGIKIERLSERKH